MALNFLNNGYFAGKVGIGTESPDYKLDIGGTAASTDNTVRLMQNNGGTAIRVGSGGGSSDVVLLRIDGNSSAGGHDGATDSSNYGFSFKYLGTGGGNGNRFGILSDNQVAATQVEAITILQDGFIGIGNIAPVYKLDVTGSVQSYITATRYIRLQGASADFEVVSDNNTKPVSRITGTGTADLFQIFDNTTEVFTVLDGGNVGIGETSPIYPLDVAGTIRATNAAGSSYLSGSALMFPDAATTIIGANAVNFNPGTKNLLIGGNTTKWNKLDIIANTFMFSSGGILNTGELNISSSSMDVDVLLKVEDQINIENLANATIDTDRFLVSDSADSDRVKYRTGAQVLSDIGGAPATGGSYLPLAGGTMSTNADITNIRDLQVNDEVAIGGATITSRKLAIYNTNAANEIEFIGTEYTNIYSQTNSTMALEVTGAGVLQLATTGGNLTIANNGNATFTDNVGIGTTSPNNILELSKTVDSAIGPILQLTNSQYTNANDSGSSIQFRGYTVWGPGSTNPRYSEINAINGGGSVPKRIEFKFYADTDVKTPLSILQTGRVGVGTTTPGNVFVVESAVSTSAAEFINTNADANPSGIVLKKLSTSPADEDILGRIIFQGNNDNATPALRTFARIETKATNVTDGNEDGELSFWTSKNAAQSKKLLISPEGAVQSKTSGNIILNYRSGSAYSYTGGTLYNNWNKIGTFTAPSSSARIFTEILAKGDNNYPYWMKGTVMVSFYSTGVSVSCQTDGGYEGGHNFQCIVTKDGTTYDVWVRVPVIEWSSFVQYRTLNNSGFTENYVFTIASGNVSNSAPTGQDDETDAIEPNSSYRFTNSDLKSPTHTYNSNKFLVNGNTNVVFAPTQNYFTQKVGIGETNPQEMLDVGGSIVMDASNSRLKIKSGVAGTSGGVDWTFNTASTKYARIDLDYDTRASTGLLIDSAYPITMDFSSDRFAIQNNGSEKMRVETNGNVGIGTTSPSRALQVIGTDGVAKFYYNSSFTNAQYSVVDVGMMTSGTAANGFGPKITFRMGENGYDGYAAGTIGTIRNGADNTHNLNFGTSNSGSMTTKMTITNAGNVGIGTTGPTANLHISDTADAVLKIEGDTINSDETKGAKILLITDNGYRTAAITGGNATYETSSGNFNALNLQSKDIRFHTGTTQDYDLAVERMRITGTGALSFGSTGTAYGTSGQVLTSAGNAAPTWTTPTTGTVTGTGTTNRLTKFTDGANGVIGNSGIQDASNAIAITINGNEEVGINKTNPTRPLHVSGIAQIDNGSLQLGGTSSVTGTNPQLRRTNSSNDLAISTGGSDRITVLGAGNVGIGTTSPFTNLEIEGSGLDSIIRLYTATGAANIRTWEMRAVGVAGEGLLFRQVNDANTVYTNRMILDNSGNVGIGTISPNHKLDVTGDIYSSGQMLTKGADFASFTVLGDLTTGLGNFNTAGRVSLVSGGKAEITVDQGTIAFDNYTATAVATTGSLSANQGNQAPTEDTLANLCVDPDGNVVRGSQEGTWTFTKAQIDALTTSTTSGTTLIAAPGANKAIIVEESNLMIKYSGTGTMSSNSFVIRQAHNGDATAEITRLPSGQINTIMSSAPANPSYGFYSRDLPLYNNDGRSFVTNKATFLSRITTNATPTNLVSISIKLKYRIFNATTF